MDNKEFSIHQSITPVHSKVFCYGLLLAFGCISSIDAYAADAIGIIKTEVASLVRTVI